MSLIYLIIGLIIGIILGTVIILFINFKKIFLKKIEFLKNEYNIPESLIYSLYNANNKDGFLSLWRKSLFVFVFITPIITAIILIAVFFILWYGTSVTFAYQDFIIIPFFLISFIPAWPIILKKIKNLLSLNKLYKNIPTTFKYEKIVFDGPQKEVKNVQKKLIKFYKRVKPFYNSLRFDLFTIESKFNYYFVYLRTIGNLLNSKKILDFLSKKQTIEILVNNRKVNFDEFKQILLINSFCVFYYFNFYGCSTDFMNDFQEFENSENTKNGYKFDEIKESDFLQNDGTSALWSIDKI